MSDLRVAKAFFIHHLPEKIHSLIQWDSLKLKKESFVDEQLALAMTDMLYFANFAGRPGYLYLLAEHQSSPDRLMPFRLLQYTVKIMAQHIKGNPSDYLPLVYSLVFYHGQERYRYSTDIFDLFAERELAETLLCKPFQLVDVTQIPDETLKQQVWSGVIELCLKHIFARDIMPLLQEWLLPLQTLERMGGQDIIKVAMTYLITAGKVNNPTRFVETIKQGLSPTLGDTVMTLAQYWEAKGLQQEKQAIAKRCLQQGLSIEIIHQVTGLTIEEIKSLASDSPN